MRGQHEQPPPFTGGGDRYGSGRMRTGDASVGFRSGNPFRLYRNVGDGKLGGVCAGLAEYANIETWLVRLGVLIGVLFFPPIVLPGYLLLWIVLPPKPAGLFETSEEEGFWRSVATRPDQTLSGLKTKFRDLDRQLAGMEGFVASREFDLHRQFRDLEKK